MNLILTQDGDASSDVVCKWFYLQGKDFQRVNTDSYKELTEDSPIYDDYYNLEKGYFHDLTADDETDAFGFRAHYQSVWFRRPVLDLTNINAWHDPDMGESKALRSKIRSNKMQGLRVLYDYLMGQIRSSRKLGNYNKVSLNKLVVLKLAKQCGITIPNTIVCSQKSDLQAFLERNPGGIITKSISEPIHTSDQTTGEYFTTYTELIDDQKLKYIPNQFSPSLVQEKIDKAFEIRTFVLGDAFYSMAIFSQGNPQTEIDFRKYDAVTPNRTVPYQLPEEVEGKMSKLLRKLDLNCCSIDIIKSKKKEYVFLEINPVGQFGMVSAPCNYNLEYKIFKYLSNEES